MKQFLAQMAGYCIVFILAIWIAVSLSDPCPVCQEYAELVEECPCCGVKLCQSCFDNVFYLSQHDLRQAYEEGTEYGYEDGYIEGYNDSYSEWYEEGYNDGFSDGCEAGYEDGYHDAEHDMEK